MRRRSSDELLCILSGGARTDCHVRSSKRTHLNPLLTRLRAHCAVVDEEERRVELLVRRQHCGAYYSTSSEWTLACRRPASRAPRPCLSFTFTGKNRDRVFAVSCIRARRGGRSMTASRGGRGGERGGGVGGLGESGTFSLSADFILTDRWSQKFARIYF